MRFKKFNELLTTTPILTLQVHGEGFTVYFDAFIISLGCLLMQKGQVISYVSRNLKLHERFYSTRDFELASVVLTLKILRD